MRRVIGAIGMVLIAGGAAWTGGCAATRGREVDHESARAVASDFDVLLGGAWSGTLTYRDYTSGQATTIRSTLRVTRAGDGWRVAIGYDDEPDANAADELRLADGGATIRFGDAMERVVRRRVDGARVAVETEHAGTDDDRPATIRRTYRLSAKEASLRKEVRFAGDGGWLVRNEYLWTR